MLSDVQHGAVIVDRHGYGCWMVCFARGMMFVFGRLPSFPSHAGRALGWFAPSDKRFRPRFSASASLVAADVSGSRCLALVPTDMVAGALFLGHYPTRAYNDSNDIWPALPRRLSSSRSVKRGTRSRLVLVMYLPSNLRTPNASPVSRYSLNGSPIFSELTCLARTSQGYLAKPISRWNDEDAQEPVTWFCDVAPVRALPQSGAAQRDYSTQVNSISLRGLPEGNPIRSHLRDDMRNTIPSVLRLRGHREELFGSSRRYILGRTRPALPTRPATIALFALHRPTFFRGTDAVGSSRLVNRSSSARGISLRRPTRMECRSPDAAQFAVLLRERLVRLENSLRLSSTLTMSNNVSGIRHS